jgi:hypothetical protein
MISPVTQHMIHAPDAYLCLTGFAVQAATSDVIRRKAGNQSRDQL